MNEALATGYRELRRGRAATINGAQRARRKQFLKGCVLAMLIAPGRIELMTQARLSIDDIAFIDDVAFVDRRSEQRIIVSVAARYALANRIGPRGNRREFSCRIVNISTSAMTLVVPVNGTIGERVIVRCDEFGKLEGAIVRTLDRGFVMKMSTSDEERAKFAAKIDWYEKNKNHDVADSRAHKRILPNDPRSILVLADGTQMECFVIDMSISGAAVSADIKPDIGTPLAVGKVVGRVVRHRQDGFAVQFIHLQDFDALEQRLIQS